MTGEKGFVVEKPVVGKEFVVKGPVGGKMPGEKGSVVGKPVGGKRTVAVITGGRTSYGIYAPVMDAIDKREGIDYFLVVTCMHLMKSHGHTIDEIRADGRKIGAVIDMQWEEDSLAGQSKAIGRAIIAFTDLFAEKGPDIVLVQGDRGETVAAAIAAAHLNIPVAHMHGGEISGNIDESNRHATTKYSHIHLVSTRKSAERVIKLGERPETVFVVGAAGIDGLRTMDLPSKAMLAEKYGFDAEKPFLLVIQHPCTGEVKQSGRQMQETLLAVGDSGVQAVVVYSNSDAGNRPMLAAIERAAASSGGRMRAFPNVNHTDYLALMKHAAALVGNSSGGVIEAPSFGLPAVNIGARQRGRERAKNIIDVGHGRKQILGAIERALHDKDFLAVAGRGETPYDPFGTADAGRRIADILAETDIGKKLLLKKIVY